MSILIVEQELYQQACAAAEAQGKTVERFVDEVLRQAIAHLHPHWILRNGLPVMVVSQEIPAIDPTTVRHYLEEEGL